MPNEPHWVSGEDAVLVNRKLVFQTGEPHLVRDLGLLESACAVPRNQWAYGGETDAATLATALLLALARNHPLIQGNKRTAFVAAIVFLEWTGWEMPAELDFGPMADVIVAALKGKTAGQEITSILRQMAQRPPRRP